MSNTPNSNTDPNPLVEVRVNDLQALVDYVNRVQDVRPDIPVSGDAIERIRGIVRSVEQFIQAVNQ